MGGDRSDPVVSRFVRTRIEEWLREHPGGSGLELARLTGLTGATISDLRSRKRGAGQKVVEGFSRLLGMDPPGLYAQAYAWAKDNPESVSSAPAPADDAPAFKRYPNLRPAWDAARRLGVPEAVLEPYRTIALNSDRDLDVWEWLDEIRADARRAAREVPPTPVPIPPPIRKVLPKK